MAKSKLTIWHNPRCSKSRQTLALIEDAGEAAEIFLYLDNPVGQAEIAEMITKLGLKSARDLMRKGEAIYKELDLKNETNEAALVKAMASHPKMIERPIVTDGKQAILGRPPENVNKLL